MVDTKEGQNFVLLFELLANEFYEDHNLPFNEDKAEWFVFSKEMKE